MDTVYRWPYNSGNPPGIITIPGESVVVGMPTGGHPTRTLVFDGHGYLYVSIGSARNVDETDWRSRVMRFSPAQYNSGSPVTWTDGQVFARGLRNEVALCFDGIGRLWGVENGVDDLSRADLGGDVHIDNPGEEVNLLQLGDGNVTQFYGYPSCWSQGPNASFPGALLPGSQWALFDLPHPYTDAECRDVAQVVPPQFVLPAHVAPLGCAFSTDPSWGFVDDMFVAAHGSWDRVPAAGYSLYHISFLYGRPVSSEIMIGTGAPQGNFRPVSIVFDGAGRAFLSSDAEGKVYVIARATATDDTTTTTTTTTTPTTTTTTASTTSVPTTGMTHSVIVGPTTDPFTYFLEPGGGNEIVVDMGDEILWTWATNDHSVTFGDDCTPNGRYDTEVHGVGFSTMTQISGPLFAAGMSYNFFCMPHCNFGQVGKIVVRGGTGTTTVAPTTTIAPTTTTKVTPIPTSSPISTTTATTTTTTTVATTTPVGAGDLLSPSTKTFIAVLVIVVAVALSVFLVIFIIKRRRQQQSSLVVNTVTQDGEQSIDLEGGDDDLL